MVQQPFWEKEYLADTHFAFGNPSEEVVEWAKKLPADARILDIGCGDGRHAVYLAQLGFKVEAIDISEAGIAKINRYKASHQLHNLQADVQDITTYQFSDTYHCIISHGLFHFLAREDWHRIIQLMQDYTKIEGINIITVFTDEVDIPEDLAPFVKGICQEGEIRELYEQWSIAFYRSYQFEDQHENNIRHCHAANKLVAIKRAL
ncbi:methyltransferase domain-containing protein [Lysinibacillus mangiferihumi]|uniref:Methyltransferase domain-containing protein n=1 Tax=Lysinibacillus mangiferihumi TaxID=1130819 RepID=A0A4U2YEW5_9BACI|nr:methyltransferase domain-containing protein [Lysinibacillus mangiferihumi]TKI59448.1 methyltransferase domain-containing protein [Lysinibacillus mangiferihumi]